MAPMVAITIYCACTSTWLGDHRGNRRERTRMRQFEDEKFFGLQIATNAIVEGAKAAHMAHASNAAFIDLNTGCPIYGCALPLHGFLRISG